MTRHSIDSLILKTAHSDREAFQTLYLEMQKPVYYYALRFCGSHELAEDVLQDTFITVWSKSGSFVPSGNGRAWILKIAKNKAINAVKQNQRVLPLEEADIPCQDNDGLLFNAIEAKTTLGELLNTLNKREADIVILRHTVGLTLTEIAAERCPRSRPRRISIPLFPETTVMPIMRRRAVKRTSKVPMLTKW